MHMARNPATAAASELIAELGRVLPSGIYNNEKIHKFSVTFVSRNG